MEWAGKEMKLEICIWARLCTDCECVDSNRARRVTSGLRSLPVAAGVRDETAGRSWRQGNRKVTFVQTSVHGQVQPE